MQFNTAIATDIAAGLAVSSTSTVYTNYFPIVRNRYYGIEIKMASDTDVQVLVQLEQANVKPTTDGAADSNYVVAISDIGTIQDELVHLYPVAPIVTVYGRFKITGQGSNSTTTTVDRLNWVEAG